MKISDRDPEPVEGSSDVYYDGDFYFIAMGSGKELWLLPQQLTWNLLHSCNLKQSFWMLS